MAILNTSYQICDEALQVIYRETKWHIKIPAAAILPRSPYWAFGSLAHLQEHPFFKKIRNVVLEFENPHLERTALMGSHCEVTVEGRSRVFHPPTDVLPKQHAVEQIVNALLSVTALKSVAIEWSDIIGWGQWEQKFPILQPLGKLPVKCEVKRVHTDFTSRIETQLYHRFLPKDIRHDPAFTLRDINQEIAARRSQSSIGKQKLSEFLATLKNE